MARLQGRVAIITGASSGFGRAIALEYAKEGALIACADLQENARNDTTKRFPLPTHKLIEQNGGKAIFVRTDVRDESNIEALVSTVVAKFGRLDIMVNNAGIADDVLGLAKQVGGIRLHEVATELFDLTMAINVRGVFLGSKYAIAQFLRQEPLPPNNRGDMTRGWIVNTASLAGIVGLTGAPSYVASKHAVVGLTKQTAIDYSKDRIHCNALCPSFCETALIAPITQDSENPVAVGTKAALVAAHPWNALGTVQDVAKAAVFLVSDASEWMTGHALVIDGGYSCA